MRKYIDKKNQIRELGDVFETIKVMEKIAASAVHSLKQEVAALDAYAEKTTETLARISLFYPELEQRRNASLGNGMSEKRGGKALIVLTGDKGLVGGLWHDLIDALYGAADKYQTIIFYGTKGKADLTGKNIRLFAESEKEKMIEYVFGGFGNKEFSAVDVLYPHFISLAEQHRDLIKFLPFSFNYDLKTWYNNGERESGFLDDIPKDKAVGIPIFSPSAKKIFDSLFDKYAGTFLKKMILETKLSELSARTVATEHASAKTETIIKKLKLSYEKDRHAELTQKQLENFSAKRAIAAKV